MLITGSFPPMKCGVGDYTSLLAEGLAARPDIKVAVLTSTVASGNAVGVGVEVRPQVPTWSLVHLFKVLKIIRSWAPDIVHIQYPTLGYGRKLLPYWLPVALGFMGIRVIQTWHEILDWKSRLRYLPNALMQGEWVVVRPNYLSRLPIWYQWIVRQKHLRFIRLASNIPRITLTDSERASVRAKWDCGSLRLIAWFGFASVAKGIEQLFDIADSEQDRIILICELNRENAYHKKLLSLVEDGPWAGKAFVTGFLSKEAVAQILAAADAVVFPFLTGVEMRNASFFAARAQGCFVLATSRDRNGYDVSENVYYARPGDIDEMRTALKTYSGRFIEGASWLSDWDAIAAAHRDLYAKLVHGESKSA